MGGGIWKERGGGGSDQKTRHEILGGLTETSSEAQPATPVGSQVVRETAFVGKCQSLFLNSSSRISSAALGRWEGDYFFRIFAVSCGEVISYFNVLACTF